MDIVTPLMLKKLPLFGKIQKLLNNSAAFFHGTRKYRISEVPLVEMVRTYNFYF
jgi:hypothetical protein